VERPRPFTRTSPWRAGELLCLGLALATLLGQQLAIRTLAKDGFDAELRRAVFFITTAVLISLAWPFRRYAGAWLVAAGIALNFVPMAAHGGLMPVSYDIVRESGVAPAVDESDVGRQIDNSKDIVLLRNDIHFYALSDQYVVTAPVYGTNIYSLGDLVMFAGLGLVAVQVVVAPFRRVRGQVTEDREQIRT
jgi:hypothetical protein